MPVEKARKFGMIGGWPNQSDAADWRMHIPSPVFAPCNALMGSSVTRVLASSHSCGGEKTVCGTCGTAHRTWYDRRRRRVRDLPCADYRIYLDLEVRRVDCRRCGTVKRERLDFLVENALHTKRLAASEAVREVRRDDRAALGTASPRTASPRTRLRSASSRA